VPKMQKADSRASRCRTLVIPSSLFENRILLPLDARESLDLPADDSGVEVPSEEHEHDHMPHVDLARRIRRRS
jgi:hypothetical protein